MARKKVLHLTINKSPFTIMNKANQAPIELCALVGQKQQCSRLFLEVPGNDSCFGTHLRLSLNAYPTVCGLRHALHQPNSSPSRMHAVPSAE